MQRSDEVRKIQSREGTVNTKDKRNDFLIYLMGNITHEIRKIVAKYHLKFRCSNCPKERRKSRDVLNQGECFWYANWKLGKYNLRSYQSYILFKKFGIERSLSLK